MILGFANGVLSNPQIAISGNAYPAILTHANTTVKTYTLPDTTGQVLLNNNVLGYALPALTTGFLNWTGSAWAFSAAGGSVSTTDVSTGGPFYPVMATTAGGSTLDTSSTKLSFTPSTGTLATNILTLSVASSIAALSFIRSDLSNTVTLTQTAANILTSTAQIVLPNDPTTNLQSATKQYVDNNLATIQPASIAAAIGPWTAYTPIWTGASTNPVIGNGTITGYWRRIGDSIEIMIELLPGSSTTFGSGAWGFSLPPGLTIDLTKTTSSNILGAMQVNPGALTYVLEVRVGSVANTLGAYTSSGWLSSMVPATWGTASSLDLRATIPISQYSSNINLLTNFTEYAYNTSTTTATDTSSYGNGQTGAFIQAFAPTGFTAVQKQVKFLTPILSTDILILEMNNGSGWYPNWMVATTITSTSYGVLCQTDGVNAYTASVYFYSGYDAGTSHTWSVLSAWKWRVRKISNGNFAQGSPSFSNTYGDGSSTTIVVTHNLGVTDCNVAIWELTGNKRKIDSSVEIQNTNSTQVTLKFLTAPALNSIRVDVFSSGGTVATQILARTTASVTTASLAVNATESDPITMAKIATVLGIQTNYPAWIRLYSSDAARTADASRLSTVYPASGAGIVLDAITSAGALSIWLDPKSTLANHDSPVTATGYLSIKNLDSVARSITLTVTYLPLEV